MKLESMSKNIVSIMWAMATQNEGLARLLVYDTENPFDTSQYNTTDEIVAKGNNPKFYILQDGMYILPPPVTGSNLLKSQKIAPTPFDVDSLPEEDNSLIRIYYNQGQFNDNEVIAESELILDIICARNLWLINDNGISQIRPYEILGRIIDVLGKRSIGTTIKLDFQGFQHLYVNAKYDCIRLYADYMSVET